MKRYVHKNKVDQCKKEGWVEIESDYRDLHKSRTQANRAKHTGDVVLMQKEDKVDDNECAADEKKKKGKKVS